LITIVGIPVAVAVLALYVLVLILSGAFVSYRVGMWSLERLHRSVVRPGWRAMAFGALIMSLGLSRAVVGWIVMLAVLMTGVGALALECRERRALARGAGVA